ncbi:hypothetical protein H5410_031232 [Solanum commersonii]|uniref:Uncharacterized protein n=1 Tax=Solanum commersonii TaxID=4109 RepID=A0A9J5YLP1_SOLCO|nr:hypothetical protein H5410_031232 [Solanum commersonii]
MAHEPPVGLLRPPGQSHSECYDNSNKTHRESPTKSSNNFVNSLNSETVNTAISKKEGIDSYNQEIHHTKKSLHSIEPNARIGETNFERIAIESHERRPQIRTSSQEL